MRQPEPYWKSSHKCWYVNIQGRPHRLDPDKKKAQDEYHQLMAGTRPVGPKTLVAELVAEFLDWSKENNAPETYEWYRSHLESFSKAIARLRVCDLKPYHVERWVSKTFKTKNGNTLHGAYRTVVRVFNWAARSGRIASSPLAGMVKPSPTPRDAYLSPDQYKALMAAVKDDCLRDMISTLRETGCRPQEARMVEARHFDAKERCWVFPKEEAKGRNEERIVHLNDKALAITQRLIAQNASLQITGELFRNRRGNPWSKDALARRCLVLSKKLGFPICPYALRMTFATDAIVAGVDVITLSRLMGHKDLKMLQRVYAKVQKRSDHLRDALKKATA